MFGLGSFFLIRAVLRGQSRVMTGAGNLMNKGITQGIGGGGPNLAGPVMGAGAAGLGATEVAAAAGTVGAIYYIRKQEEKWGGTPADTHPGLTGILGGIGCIALALVTFGFAQPYPESHQAGWFILIIGLVLGIIMLARGIESAIGSTRKRVPARPAPLVSRQAYLASEARQRQAATWAALDKHADEAMEMAARLRKRGL